MIKRLKTNSNSNLEWYKEFLNPETVLNNYMSVVDVPNPEIVQKIYDEFPNARLYISPDIYSKIDCEIIGVLIQNGWSPNNLLEILSMYKSMPEHTAYLIPHLHSYKFKFKNETGNYSFIPSLFDNLDSLELLLEHEIITVDDDLMMNVFTRIVMVDKEYQNRLCKILYKYHPYFRKWSMERYKEIRELIEEENNYGSLTAGGKITLSEKLILKHYT
jgi:hypothetical protein